MNLDITSKPTWILHITSKKMSYHSTSFMLGIISNDTYLAVKPVYL
jgi:hypothetical protein